MFHCYQVMIFVKLVQRSLYLIVISVRGVFPMDVLSCPDWESYSFNSAASLVSICCFSLWPGGLKVSALPFPLSFFSGNAMHSWCIWAFYSVRYFIYGQFQMAYVFSFVKMQYVLVQFDTRMFTDVFPLLLCMPFMMLIFGSFPFVESWSLIKYVICLPIVHPWF